eukprot:TRINITY_DN3349_c0_g1_i7.p1 TRINITY_DN3349_c0_g1~~TRINITY_DN3349_c0_g1_i7.p1  ORF type:complete len:495 (-),score=33.14 TRINITY_DN3349_c0_g1_i7:471-1955(-)
MVILAYFLLSYILGKSFVQGQSCDYSNVDKQCLDDADINFCGEIAGLNTYNAQPCVNQFMIALQEDRIGQEGCFFHACGATLIAPNLVITAAHCIYPKISEQGVLTGDTLKSNLYAAHVPSCRHYQGYARYKVVRYWIYEQYDDSTLKNDIAILQLNSSVQYPTIAKYDATTIQKELFGADLNIVGWGATNNSEQLNVNYNVTPLKGVLEMKLVPREYCALQLRNTGEFSILYPGMICAQKVAADACSGDSGGPLIYKKSDTLIYLVGVVSWGARGSQCFQSDNVTLPGVYTNVTYYKHWINNIMQLVNPTADIQLPTDDTNQSSQQDKVFPNFQTFEEKSGLDPYLHNLTYSSLQDDVALLGAVQQLPQIVENSQKTINGCDCMNKCENPDNDPNGNWCQVNPSSCPELAYTFPTEFYYDYCIQKYRGNSSRVGNCNGGCLCKPIKNDQGELMDSFCESPSWIGNLFGYKPYCEVINSWECNQKQNKNCKNQC